MVQEGNLMCSCHRDPQASTIQDFNDEIEEFHHMNYKNVEINNCSASHYTILIQLGEDGINIRNFTFKNFRSGSAQDQILLKFSDRIHAEIQRFESFAE